jgi:hypothetical protein
MARMARIKDIQIREIRETTAIASSRLCVNPVVQDNFLDSILYPLRLFCGVPFPAP